MVIFGIIAIWWLCSSIEVYKTNNLHKWNCYLIFTKILEFFSIM